MEQFKSLKDKCKDDQEQENMLLVDKEFISCVSISSKSDDSKSSLSWSDTDTSFTEFRRKLESKGFRKSPKQNSKDELLSLPNDAPTMSEMSRECDL